MNKKVFISLLVICSIIFINVPVIAAENNMQHLNDAEALKNLGLFKGSDKGFELERAPNRLECGVMLIRLLGKEEEALNMNYSHPFTDVPGWGNPYVGYMYEKGLTQGVGNNQYGSTQLINTKSYVTFVLRALGYDDKNGDFTWNEALIKGNEVGLIDENNADQFNGGKVFLRDDMAGISFNALQTNMKDKTGTLITKLVSEGAVEEAVAQNVNWNGENSTPIIEKETKTKITFFDLDGSYHKLLIDRNTVPESMKDFYKVWISGWSANKSNADVYEEIFSDIEIKNVKNQGKYDEIFDEFSYGVYGLSLITLYDANNNLLGWTLVEDVGEGEIFACFKEASVLTDEEISFEKWQKINEDVDISHIKYISNLDGLYFREDSNKVYLNTNQIPKELEDAVYWHTIGSGDLSANDFFNWYFEHLESKDGKETSAVGIGGNFQNGVYSKFYALFYNSDLEVIAYTFIEDKSNVKNSDDYFVQIKIKHDSFDVRKYGEDNDCLYFGNLDIYSPIFKVERYVNGQIDNNFACGGGSTGFVNENTTVIGPFIKENKNIEYRVTSDVVDILDINIEDWE